jgi:hypothetical protein
MTRRDQLRSKINLRSPATTLNVVSKSFQAAAKPAIINLLLAFALFCLSASTAEARRGHYAAAFISQTRCSDPIMRPCAGMEFVATPNTTWRTRHPRSRALAVRLSREVYRGSVPARLRESNAMLLGGVVSPLASKVREIASSCGSSVISGVRHTHIASTRTMSLHASGQAVDMKGNPRCIYQHLSGWPGGYSTDYGRVQHVHISYSAGGREWGLRFAHGGHHAHRSHHHQRYAWSW